MKKLILAGAAAVVAMVACETQAQTQRVQVTVTSNAPTGGVALTPLWAGFHDGSFDSYNGGQAAQAGIERIAEDGDASLLSSDFQAGYTYVDSANLSNRVLTSQTTGRQDAVIGSPNGPPPIQPGESASSIFDLDLSENRFFSYASMILPSNDFLVFNGNPLARDVSSIFSGGGPISFNIGVAGDVNDAGTEVNDFANSPGNPLFGLPVGQTIADQGTAENGVITNITSSDPFGSFLNTPDGVDLSQLNFNNTDLYANGIATITISAVAVPEPSSFALLTLGLGAVFSRRRRS